MTKEERLEMVNKINPVPIVEESEEEPVIIPHEEPEIIKPKVNPMVEKFKMSFYKIHGRYPSDEEVAASLGSLYKEDNENVSRPSFFQINKDSETSSEPQSPIVKRTEPVEEQTKIQIDSETEDEV